MRRQYMDFVPTKSAKTSKNLTKKPTKVAKTFTTHKVTRTSTAHYSTTPYLGVVENLTPKVSASVSSLPTKNRPSNIKAIKSQKIGNKSPVRPVEKPVEKSIKVKDKKTYEPPKFINQDKVKKRPLSKNIYRRKPAEVKEKAKSPVTIITKPEKDSKTGLIITIIITIILGAAAGTVAFLLLPK